MRAVATRQTIADAGDAQWLARHGLMQARPAPWLAFPPEQLCPLRLRREACESSRWQHLSR